MSPELRFRAMHKNFSNFEGFRYISTLSQVVETDGIKNLALKAKSKRIIMKKNVDANLRPVSRGIDLPTKASDVPSVRNVAIDHYAIINNICLHYVEGGLENKRGVVVLIHGVPQFWYTWRKVIPSLVEAGYRVIAPDLRGFNLSGRTSRLEDYSLHNYAKDISELIALLKEEDPSLSSKDFTVVGHDLGTFISWYVGLDYGQEIGRILVTNGPQPALWRDTVVRIVDREQFAMSWYACDLIVGANVLHGTQDLKESIDRLRDLLVPGGVLLLLEITRHPYWLDIVFGLMDGWWNFRDRELRPQHSLMIGSKWATLLDTCAFEQTTIVADSVDTGEAAQSIILSRKPTEVASTSAQNTQDVKRWLIFADRCGVGSALSAIMRTRGFVCTLVSPGDEYRRSSVDAVRVRPGSVEDMRRLLDEMQSLLPRIEGIVHLWNINTGQVPSSTNEDESFVESDVLGCGSLLAILQGAVLPSDLGRRSLVIVTSGAQVTFMGEEPALLQSAIWGFGRVVLKEFPRLHCKMIDLSAACRSKNQKSSDRCR